MNIQAYLINSTLFVDGELTVQNAEVEVVSLDILTFLDLLNAKISKGIKGLDSTKHIIDEVFEYIEGEFDHYSIDNFTRVIMDTALSITEEDISELLLSKLVQKLPDYTKVTTTITQDNRGEVNSALSSVDTYDFTLFI